MKKMNHPNIIKVYDFIVDKFSQESYLIMDLIEFPSLKRQVELRGKISEYQTKIIAKQIIQGIQVIHKNGVCHRDLSMSNVLCKIEKGKVLRLNL